MLNKFLFIYAVSLSDKRVRKELILSFIILILVGIILSFVVPIIRG